MREMVSRSTFSWDQAAGTKDKITSERKDESRGPLHDELLSGNQWGIIQPEAGVSWETECKVISIGCDWNLGVGIRVPRRGSVPFTTGGLMAYGFFAFFFGVDRVQHVSDRNCDGGSNGVCGNRNKFPRSSAARVIVFFFGNGTGPYSTIWCSLRSWISGMG